MAISKSPFLLPVPRQSQSSFLTFEPLVFTPALVPVELAPEATPLRAGILPIFQPQPRRVLTTFGVIATATGIRMNMNDL